MLVLQGSKTVKQSSTFIQPIMPSIPKWMETMETVFSSFLHPVTVTETVYLHPKLKKDIAFEGDLSRARFTAGNIVQFRVSDKRLPSLYPLLFDADIVVFVKYCFTCMVKVRAAGGLMPTGG